MVSSLILYNLGLILALVTAAPFWIIYLFISPKARNGLFQKLGFYPERFIKKVAIAHNQPKVVWFHAVSVGEFNAIRPLIDQISQSCGVVISTTTRTGQCLARQIYPDYPVFYFPLDFRRCIHRAFKVVQPDLVVLTETELWPNFIDIVTRRYKTPLILINGRISPKSFKGYQTARFIIAPVLSQITHLYMQSQGDAERIQAMGAPLDCVSVAGNIKFDIALTEPDPLKTHLLQNLLGFSSQDVVLCLASTHSGEDEPLVNAYLSLKRDFPELKLVLAPRHPERAAEIRNLLNSKSLGFSFRSQLSDKVSNSHPIVVLDTIGELLSIFRLSSIAIMGGSFIKHGGQNPLEPLSQKIPVIFGPNMFNFPDISQSILEYQAGFQVADTIELERVIVELLTQPELVSNVVENGIRLLEANQGAQAILNQGIQDLLSVTL